jgi:hypothetical protein
MGNLEILSENNPGLFSKKCLFRSCGHCGWRASIRRCKGADSAGYLDQHALWPLILANQVVHRGIN